MDEQRAAGELKERFYTVLQLAERWELHPFTVRRKIWTGDIKAVRLGARSIRVPESEVRRHEASAV